MVVNNSKTQCDQLHLQTLFWICIKKNPYYIFTKIPLNQFYFSNGPKSNYQLPRVTIRIVKKTKGNNEAPPVHP